MKVDAMDLSLSNSSLMVVTADMRDKGRLLTGDTIKSRTVVEFASGKGHE